MAKKYILFIIILFFQKNIFAQKYFQIEGTKRIFTFYGKKRSSQINDSATVFYYVKNNHFYIAVKIIPNSVRPYVKYDILSKKTKSKISSIGRGSDKIVRVRYINVNVVKPEKISAESQFIEEIIKR